LNRTIHVVLVAALLVIGWLGAGSVAASPPPNAAARAKAAAAARAKAAAQAKADGKSAAQSKSADPLESDNDPETSIDQSFTPSELKKLAVIVASDQKRRTVPWDYPRLVEDIFVETLLKKGHVIVARSDIGSVLKEQNLAKSGLTDSDAAAAGKLLNVPAVLVLRIEEFGSEAQGGRARITVGRATLGARLISVDTGGILWQGALANKKDVDGKADQQQLLAKTAKQLAGAFPDKKQGDFSSFDPKDIPKLALIMDGKNQARNMTTDQNRLVEDKLSILLGNKGYTLVSRSDLQAVLEEKQFQKSGVTEQNVSDLGKLLNVPAVMVVKITLCDAENARQQGANAAGMIGSAALGARLVSVETGEIIWCRTLIDSREIATKGAASDILVNVAKKVGEMFPSKGSTKKTASDKRG
jgi:PBP1b-binding outer membrane lipoprotein LpoB